MKYSQTIYLGVDDDIALAIDKVAGAGTPEVILVIPQNAEIFSSIVNLKLLRREAENLNKHLVIATTDRIGMHLVERAGIELDKFDGQPENNSRSEESGKKSRKETIIEKQEEYSIGAGNDKVENYGGHENAGKISLLKETVSPRIMADIVIPVRKIEPVDKKVFEKKENFVYPEKDIEFNRTETLIDTAEESMEPTKHVQTGHSQEPVEAFWGQTSHEPAFSSESYKEEKIKEPEQVYFRSSKSTVNAVDEAGRKEFAAGESMDVTASAAVVYIPEAQKEKRAKLFAAKRTKKLAYAFVAAGLVVFFAAAYFILPRAKLIISPKKQNVAYSLSIVADKNITKIDYSLKRIPAQLIKIEKKETKEFPATGTSDGNQKAHGIITIYNNYSTASQGLVATTRFVAKDSGKLFRATKTITVPGAKMEGGKLVPSSIDAEVAADQPGSDYNIGPSEFTIPGFSGTPKYAGFYGKSKAVMSGGSAGKAKIVSAENLENATKAMKELLKSSQAQELKNQIPANLKLLDGALQEGEPEITFSIGVGAAAENFTASIKAQIIALVFDPKYVKDLVAKNNSAIANGKIDSNNIDYTNWKVNFDKGQISMDLKISQQGTGKVDIANLKKLLAGKDEVEIRKALSQISEVQSAKISFWPFWVKSMPVQPDKIEITIEQNN